MGPSFACGVTGYYDFNGAPIAMRNSSSSVEYMMADPQGTATVSFDGLTTAISRRFMDSYGNPRGTPSPTWEQNSHGFVNGVDDTSTGLTHLGAREYDSKLGRFISVDSILDPSDPITLNGYRYGNNSPASYSDPEGLRDMLETPDDGGKPPGAGEPQTWREKSSEEIEEISHKVVLSEVTHHREAKEEAKRIIKKVIKDLVKIVADELGITDALNCFTDGDIGACVSTGVTVLSSFAGGVAGKLLSKYFLHAKKAWKLVGRIKDLIGEAIDGIKGFRKAEEELHKAETVAAKVGESCTPNSFSPGTMVLLADGTYKPIEQVKLGGAVVASDPSTGRVSTEQLAGTIAGHGMKDLVEL
jgi:RHS repeat-associated protein